MRNMNNYNLVIIENKQYIPFLNLTEQEFYDKLWEWTYEDDLWDYIDENNPTDEGIVEYQISDRLIEFIKSKIKEHYD